MRLPCLPVLLLVVVGTSIAQSANFASGPQYLVTTENPMFLRSIATPSLDLSAQTLAGTTDVPGSVELPAIAPAETIMYLHEVYWGEHSPEQSFVPLLEPPSMTAHQTSWYMNYVANQATPDFSGFSGPELAAPPNVIEIAGGPMPPNLPASIFDPGVTGTTSVESLRQSGYGVSLGEVAAYWKAHKGHASHVITDEDLRRR